MVNPRLLLKLETQKMVPLDAATLEDLVQSALFNIRQFDLARFAAWIKTQPGDVEALTRLRPPFRLYRVISDNERERRGAPLLLGVIVGYATGRRGAPALCGVQILGIKSGAGSPESLLPVPAEALEDVTERAQAGRLTIE